MRHLLLDSSKPFKVGTQYPFYAYIPYARGVKRFRLHAYISKVSNTHFINFEKRNYVIKVILVKDLNKRHVTEYTSKGHPVYTVERLR